VRLSCLECLCVAEAGEVCFCLDFGSLVDFVLSLTYILTYCKFSFLNSALFGCKILSKLQSKILPRQCQQWSGWLSSNPG